MSLILAALAASALSGIFGGVAKARQNRFNNPTQQLKRLRKAGLPLSYMYGGKVATQNSSQELEIDPYLGQSEEISKHNETQITDANLALLGEELNIKKSDTEHRKQEDAYDFDAGLNIPPKADGTGGFAGTNKEYKMKLKRDKLEAETFIKENEAKLKNILANVEQDLFNNKIQIETREQNLEKIKEQIKLMGQLGKIRQFEELWKETMGDALSGARSFMSGLYSFFVKIAQIKNSPYAITR